MAAIVTGGARRIGREISLELARQGYTVIIHCLSSVNEAHILVDEIKGIGGSAVPLKLDLTDSSSVNNFIECAKSLSKVNIEVLVNCASLYEFDRIENLTESCLQRHMQVNVLVPLLLSSQFLAYRKTCGFSKLTGCTSSIINILDQIIAAPHGDNLSYNISRIALSGLTTTLAKDFAPFVRVNAVAPGFTLPAPRQSLLSFEKCQQESPLGYGPKPADIAAAVSYLVKAPAVTGQTIFVDAGERLNGRNSSPDVDTSN